MSKAELIDRSADRQRFVLAEFLPYRLVALGHLVSRRLARVYENENLSIPEWRVLAAIGQADRMAARDVAALTPMDKMAVSRAVASLEGRGMVLRRLDPSDRRVSMLLLSEKGRALYERVAQLALAYEKRLLSALSEDERRCLATALARLEDAATRDGP